MGVFTTAVRRDDITDANTKGTDSGTQPKVTTFITQQSLTYPVAVVLIGILWAGAQVLGDWGKSPWVPLALSVITVGIGLLTTWEEIKGIAKKGAAIGLAVLNAGLLFAAVIGIDLSKLGDQLQSL
jgi:hypothetical protein